VGALGLAISLEGLDTGENWPSRLTRRPSALELVAGSGAMSHDLHPLRHLKPQQIRAKIVGYTGMYGGLKVDPSGWATRHGAILHLGAVGVRYRNETVLAAFDPI
jgi:hypothetical protein